MARFVNVGSLLALLIFGAVATTPTAPAMAQADEGSFSVSHTHDSFFGAWTGVTASLPLTSGLQLTTYGILWDTFLWTEFGGGVTFDAGPFSVSTLVGITNGTVLSGGGQANATRVFNDGVVPNITLTNNTESFEGQIYAGYYIATRETTAAGSNDYLHHWVYQGYKLTPAIAAGVHWEHLENTRSPGGANNTYAWVGPYLSMTIKKNFSFRFAGGADLSRGNQGFYKSGLALTF